MARLSLENPEYYLNRDTSWIAFNSRVLEEAYDEGNPLLERLKFLAISASNLDEFFEIRVAAMMQQIEDGYNQAGPDGLTLTEKRDVLAKQTHEFVDDQYGCWNAMRPALAEHGIRVLSLHELHAEARRFVDEYCEKELDPMLTPVTVDPTHPFPRVINKALCLGLLLRRRRRSALTYTGVVSVPRSLPRLIRLPSENTTDFIFLADLVAHHAQNMYHGYDIVSSAPFRVTRNSNLYLQEEESRSVLESVREELHNRRKGDAVRMEIESSADEEMIERLRINFELESAQVFRTDGPVNLSRLMNLYSGVKQQALKYPPFVAKDLKLSAKSIDIFDELRKRDVMLHHPFDSYKAVEEFIEAGAKDPSVISMKQTLYRTSSDSPIFKALTEAGQSKEVTVVVELMARFDEDSNIRWARELEDAGVGVFHGIFGLKTHCKLALLVRRDPDGVVRRYAHLGTGNYNPVTARFYTDISLLTSNPELTAAVQKVFNYLTAETESDSYAPLMVAPLTLADRLVALIDREAAHAKAGRPAAIVAKMNGLIDRRTVEALYAASQAGVEIDLIVRGMCSLRPGVKGLSERIRVRSIVGRFLEHSRIFNFANGGEEEIYCGSADWMPRNLIERCEVLFPMTQPDLQKRLRAEILAAYLADNSKARLLQPDGEYVRAPRVGTAFGAQDFLIRRAEGSEEKVPEPVKH